MRSIDWLCIGSGSGSDAYTAMNPSAIPIGDETSGHPSADMKHCRDLNVSMKTRIDGIL